MTREELKEFNGQNGKPAYIGYKGKVYDVTKSDFWTNGTHMGRFNAGEDLTDSIGMSPHGEKNIFRYPEVGTLEDGIQANTASSDTVVPNSENMMSDVDRKMVEKRKWYKKNHPHPKMIHFPIGMIGYAFFAQVLAIVLHFSNMKVAGNFITATGIVVTVFAVLFIIPAVASGALSFYINYNGFANSILKKKIAGSVILFITCVAAVIIGKGEIASEGFWGGLSQLHSFRTYSPFTSIYSLLTLINMAIVTFIATQGGKITWPEDKN